MVTRVREKGQVTIPSNIRESLHLSKDSVLSVARVGDGILLIPRPSGVDAASEKFSRAAQKKGISLEALLKDLKKIRHKS